MDRDLADYIFNYCSAFFSEKESKANRHYFGVSKFKDGPDTPARIIEIRAKFTSGDPEVLKLLAEGFEQFKVNTTERIYKEHKEQLPLNLCPKCNKIARTPKAKQCRYCAHDWHDKA